MEIKIGDEKNEERVYPVFLVLLKSSCSVL